eukprot:1290717-Amphidinium_carterae.1
MEQAWTFLGESGNPVGLSYILKLKSQHFTLGKQIDLQPHVPHGASWHFGQLPHSVQFRGGTHQAGSEIPQECQQDQHFYPAKRTRDKESQSTSSVAVKPIGLTRTSRPGPMKALTQTEDRHTYKMNAQQRTSVPLSSA